MQLFSNKVFGEASSLGVLGTCVLTEDGHRVEAFLLAEVGHDGLRSFEGVGHIALESWEPARRCLTQPGGYRCVMKSYDMTQVHR